MVCLIILLHFSFYFAVDPPPRILSLQPRVGLALGGTRVTVSGIFLGRNQDDLTLYGAAVGFGI